MSNIVIPDSIHQEFTVEVRAQSLRRVRDGLEEMSRGAFTATELSLAIASLAAGCVLGALQNGVGPSSSKLWWLFLCILPAVASGFVVNYFRQKSRSVPAAMARDLLRDFPDPDRATRVFQEMERLTGAWKLESHTATSEKTSTGLINFDVTRGRVSAAGLMYGEKGTPIGGISSEICDYQPRTKQFILVYRLTAHHDNGSQWMGLCIVNGILIDEEDSNGLVIRGQWFHLQADASGKRSWGTATLTHLLDHESQE